jgi:hypothetical protein
MTREAAGRCWEGDAPAEPRTVSAAYLALRLGGSLALPCTQAGSVAQRSLEGGYGGEPFCREKFPPNVRSDVPPGRLYQISAVLPSMPNDGWQSR